MSDKKFPNGKLDDTDLGATDCMLRVQNGRVRIDFMRPMDWIAVTPDQADSLAETLRHYAQKARQ